MSAYYDNKRGAKHATQSVKTGSPRYAMHWTTEVGVLCRCTVWGCISYHPHIDNVVENQMAYLFVYFIYDNLGDKTDMYVPFKNKRTATHLPTEPWRGMLSERGECANPPGLGVVRHGVIPGNETEPGDAGRPDAGDWNGKLKLPGDATLRGRAMAKCCWRWQIDMKITAAIAPTIVAIDNSLAEVLVEVVGRLRGFQGEVFVGVVAFMGVWLMI